MKKIKIWFKKNYKKVLCAITCSVIAFCGFFSFFKPKNVSAFAVTDPYYNLNSYYKKHFNKEFFDTHSDYYFSITNTDVYTNNSHFNFGRFSYNEAVSGKTYEYYNRSNNELLAFMRLAQSSSENIVVTSNIPTNETRVIFNDICMPYSKDFNSIIDTEIGYTNAFVYALSHYLSNKYIYFEYLPSTTYSLSMSYAYNLINNDSLDKNTQIIDVDSIIVNNVTSLKSLAGIFGSQIRNLSYGYVKNYQQFEFSDYINQDYLDFTNVGGWFVVPYLEIKISNDSSLPFYLVEYGNQLDKDFFNTEFQTLLGAIINYDSTNAITFNTIYNSGYDSGYLNGYTDASLYDTPFQVVLGVVNSFLNFEIFPSFKIYYLLLMAFGVGIFGLIVKYAFGG